MNNLNQWKINFDQLGFPNKKIELWKYTTLDKFINTDNLSNLKIEAARLPHSPVKKSPFSNTEIITFDGSNWHCEGSQISRITSREAIPNIFQEQLISHDGLYSYHRALNERAVFKIKNTETLSININISTTSQDAPELYIDLSEHKGPLTIFEMLNGYETEKSYENVMYSIVVKNNKSDVTYHRFSNCSSSKNISWHRFDNAHKINLFQWKQKNQSAKEYLSINNIEEDAESYITMVANLSNEAHVDVTTQVNHLVPQTKAKQLFKVILNDLSQCSLTGKITIDKECSNTSSFFRSQHTLLSDKAQINSRPQLEIFSDDVECAHGSSTGKLQEEELFYLESRGIKTEQAKKMLLHAFILDQIEELPNLEQKIYFKELVL